MKEKTGQESLSAGRRTRSQLAPDWTVTESLILVNEIFAVEADCSNALSSYQQWKIITENCAALDVVRSLDQCRRRWDSLFADYKKIKKWESKPRAGSYWSLKSERVEKFGLPENFDRELFKAIDELVKSREERSGTEPDSDPEDEADVELPDVMEELGSKRKRRQIESRRTRIEKPKNYLPDEFQEDLSEEKPQGSRLKENPDEIPEEKAEKNHLEEEDLKDFLEQKSKSKSTGEQPSNGNLELELSSKKLAGGKLHEDDSKGRRRVIHEERKTVGEEGSKEMVALKLKELAEEIQAIGTETADCREGDSHDSAENYRAEYTRRQGDKLIASLGDFSNTLKKLCDLLQECR